MLPLHLRHGITGEKAAKRHLRRLGLKFLVANYRSHRGEIDLVFRDGECLVFVEVKTRSSVDYGLPEDFVNTKKERQLEYAANEYIEDSNYQGEIRFDIIAIVFENKHIYKINHIEDAFWPN